MPVLLASWQAAGAHTPYGQWVVYRKKHLLIGAHRADPPTYETAKRVAATLAEHLPKSRSRVARAPHAGRLASLLGTDQLDVAVLSMADAAEMKAGSGQFKPYGQIPLRLLAVIGDQVLVAHQRFPARHAWLVTSTLADEGTARRVDSNFPADIPLHPGSAKFFEGLPQPI